MRILLKLLAVFLTLAVLLVLAAPLLLYQWGLSNVEGRPQRPSQMAEATEQTRIWKQARGQGSPVVEAMNPYGFVAHFFSDSGQASPSESVAYWIARSYLPAHRLNTGTISWHVSTAALTIWLTRNWSTEEILTVASQTVSNDPRVPLKTVK